MLALAALRSPSDARNVLVLGTPDWLDARLATCQPSWQFWRVLANGEARWDTARVTPPHNLVLAYGVPEGTDLDFIVSSPGAAGEARKLGLPVVRVFAEPPPAGLSPGRLKKYVGEPCSLDLFASTESAKHWGAGESKLVANWDRAKLARALEGVS